MKKIVILLLASFASFGQWDTRSFPTQFPALRTIDSLVLDYLAANDSLVLFKAPGTTQITALTMAQLRVAVGGGGGSGTVQSVNLVNPDGAGNINLTTDNIPQGVSNFYITGAEQNAITQNTADIANFVVDSTRLANDSVLQYYQNGVLVGSAVIRVNAAAGSGVGAVDSVNGQIGVVSLDTDDIPEGVNKYVSAAEKTQIATNQTDITNLEGEQVTQNNAIALNTAKRSYPLADETRLANTSGTNTGDQDVSGIATNASAITTLDGEVVKVTGAQSVAGVKTFSSSPIVPAPTTDLQAATKKYVDDNVGGGVNPQVIKIITGNRDTVTNADEEVLFISTSLSDDTLYLASSLTFSDLSNFYFENHRGGDLIIIAGLTNNLNETTNTTLTVPVRGGGFVRCLGTIDAAIRFSAIGNYQ